MDAKHKKMMGLVSAGLVAGLTLGTLGIAVAETTSTDSTASAGVTAPQPGDRGPDGPGGAPIASADHVGGGVLADALAELTGGDAKTYMDSRAGGTSFESLAKDAGVGADDLIAKAVAIETAKLQTALVDGTTTQAQYDEIMANLEANLKVELTETDAVPAHGDHGPGGGPGGIPSADHVPGGVLADALAGLTGGDAKTYLDSRASGTSFESIAQDAGVSSDDLIAKAVALETAKLDTALADGKITQAQYDEIVANLKANVTEEFTETHAVGGPGERGPAPTTETDSSAS